MPRTLTSFLLAAMIFAALLGASCQMQPRPAQSTSSDITPREAYNRLLNTSLEFSYLETMIGLSEWDQDTAMPPKGTQYRARAQGYIADLQNRLEIDPEFARLLFIANNGSNWSVVEAANLRLWNRDYNKRIKLPSDYASRESETASLAEAAWEEAREKDNYTIFKPYLEAMIELNREKIRCWGRQEHPYDALLDNYMPGMTVAKCDRLFGSIKPRIIQLIAEMKKSNQTASKNIYGSARYPEDKQEEFTKNITIALGFDYGSGLMAKTERHPATYPIGAHDIRSSFHYNEQNPDAILYVIHECGHSIACQRIPDEYYGMPIGTVRGMNLAEAESKLFENNLARSRAFWQYWLPLMKKEFSPNMDSVSVDDMYRHINRLNLGPIHVGADEVSYILHIIIRYEIERDLFAGNISADDLPKIWNQKYRDYLGVNVTNERDGILQDDHWAKGYFGYFPAYALGSLNAAQLEAAMRRDHPDLDSRFALGDFSIPANWMEEHVYKYGAIYDTPELMKKATGNETEAYDLLNYLNRKYERLYSLT
ncbi:Thermostable carboxypeptidase 1 [uncultured archaeon]|nr:Thermostable carboxypeptidase 1 [uncultured archaeon]